MSLPLNVIDRLFSRLAMTYGREFMDRYKGLDENEVKSAWAYELACYANNLEAIGFALEHLPDRAPNVIQFKALCLTAPEKNVPLLAAPKTDPVIIKHVMEGLKKDKPKQSTNGRDWARKILGAPEGRTPTVLAMARAALETTV